MSPATRGDVLVVEDDVAIREGLRELLEDEGYEVRVAEHGRAALDRVREGLPALILLDLMMPVMDGHQFLEVLREVPDGRRVPVVVLTAADRTAPSLGRVNAVLVKPIDVGQLLGMVAACVATV